MILYNYKGSRDPLMGRHLKLHSTVKSTKKMKNTQNLTFLSILEIKKSQMKKKTILWKLTNTYLSV